MRPSLWLDPLTALRALPQAAWHAVPNAAVVAPLHAAVPGAVAHIARAARPAALAMQRAAWYSLLAGLVLLSPLARAQDGNDAPAKAESPYFFVQGAQPGVDALPLKSTDVQVNISGVIADVVVTQRYKNEGAVPIEAKYLFPGSTRAAVNGMNVRVGDRLITAQIREKRQAQVEYNAAKAEGKTAALLEQHRPNVFQMNVANILPGDDVQVELHYNELLAPTDGQYQFVYPTVVGPRYAGSHEPPRSPASPHGRIKIAVCLDKHASSLFLTLLLQRIQGQTVGTHRITHIGNRFQPAFNLQAGNMGLLQGGKLLNAAEIVHGKKIPFLSLALLSILTRRNPLEFTTTGLHTEATQA